MRVPAYAKINLSLEVLGRRADGYHEIVTVLQLVSLHDTLSFVVAGDLSLSCRPLALDDDVNLVIRSARLLKESARLPLGAAMTLQKRIPVAAGLGGGSSDAAVTLSALNRLWRLHLRRRDLSDLAATLGSDVPFFLGSSTALASGRGELVSPLPPPAPTFVVLAVPTLEIADKTRRLYAALTPDDYSDGSRTRALAKRLSSQGDIDTSLMVNAFERAACDEFLAVRKCRDLMAAAGAEWSMLSGSGPSRFTLLRDERLAAEVHRRLELLSAGSGIATLLLTTLATRRGGVYSSRSCHRG